MNKKEYFRKSTEYLFVNSPEMVLNSRTQECLKDIHENISGDFYVYGFYNEKWQEYFYIGKGCGNRIKQNKRGIHVTQILEKYPCKRIILINNLSEECAYELEQKIKETLRQLGKPLIDYENGKAMNQRKGIAIAKANGKYQGRKPIEIDSEVFKAQYNRYMSREINKTELAKVLKVSRPTLDKMIKEYV